MKVCVLASGSKGNCTYIETPKSKILIDCGISKKKLVENLSEIGVAPQDIDAIFITHEHSDHIGGVGAVSRALDIPIFAHNVICQDLLKKVGDIKPNNLVDFFDGDFYFKDFTISPFAVPHDSKHCVGFSFYSGGEKISVSTDLGTISKEILDSLKQSKTIVLESNHDIDMLKANPNYSLDLKRRILSNSGHLSNKDCANALLELYKSGTRDFVLAHLSEENNTAPLAFATCKTKFDAEKLVQGVDIEIEVANQYKPTKIHS